MANFTKYSKYERSCRQKTKRTESDTRLKLVEYKNRSVRDWKRLRFYRCSFCDGFHIGHMTKRAFTREQRVEQCVDRRRYNSSALATLHLLDMQKRRVRKWKQLILYRCAFCRKIHLGHPPASEPITTEPTIEINQPLGRPDPVTPEPIAANRWAMRFANVLDETAWRGVRMFLNGAGIAPLVMALVRGLIECHARTMRLLYG